MRSEATAISEGLILRGLDGSNPLGFLAALGTLRLLSVRSVRRNLRMSWSIINSVWRPMLDLHVSEETCIEMLQASVADAPMFPWAIDKKLPFKGETLRSEAINALQIATKANRSEVDLLAGLGSEAIRDTDGVFGDTAFRMVRTGDSSGQGLLAYAKRICEDTTRDNLCEALFGFWGYQDEQCSLRWDPIESRNYALRGKDPSKEKATSMRGANRLALEGLAVCPVIPGARQVYTVGFGRPSGRTESLTWPLWSCYLSADAVRSVIAINELQCERPDVVQLASRGVAAVFRCDRVRTSKYYSNFAPARRIA